MLSAAELIEMINANYFVIFNFSPPKAHLCERPSDKLKRLRLDCPEHLEIPAEELEEVYDPG